jgi:hypothetical protein
MDWTEQAKQSYANRNSMKFDIYGRFFVDVTRESGGWRIDRIDQGRRWRMEDLVIPADTPAENISRCLEDLLHECALPGQTIRLLD